MSKSPSRGVLPLPEVASSYRSDTIEDVSRTWHVKTVSDPTQSTSNVVDRTMSISDINDQISRVYRARELVRARVTVSTQEQVEALEKISNVDPALMEAVDAYRVNHITRELGYNTDVFGEVSNFKLTGNRLATVGDVQAWNTLVTEAIPLLGSKGYNQLVTGVRQVNPDWANQLREISNQVKYSGVGFENFSVESLGSTELQDLRSRRPGLAEPAILPYGYAYVTHVASQLKRYLKAIPDPNGTPMPMGMVKPGEEDGEFEVGLGDTDTYAPLVLDKSNPLTKNVKGYLHRKKKSSNFGKRVLYPSRMLTDPNKQIFGSKVKANGGVVVVDVSGSMSLSIDDVNSILEAAPGAVVMAYSHSGTSNPEEPNCTILAYRGKQVQKLERKMFRGGNGVDGPALEYAVKLRKGSEPIVWISDGMVTSANDGASDKLVDQTTRFILKHRIIQIPSTQKAVEQFKTGKLENKPTGFIYDSLQRMRRRA